MAIRRVAPLIAALVLAGFGGATSASASTNAPGMGTKGATSALAATCEWVVVWPSAGVYEQPTRMYSPLKVKHSGDRVGGGYCMQYYNGSEGEW